MKYILSICALFFSLTALAADNQNLYDALDALDDAEIKIQRAQRKIDRARSLILDQIDNTTDAWTCFPSGNNSDLDNIRGNGATEKKARNNFKKNCLIEGIDGVTCDLGQLNAYCVEN